MEFLREASWIPWCLHSKKLLAFPHRNFSFYKIFPVRVWCLYANKALCCSMNACIEDYASVIKTVNIRDDLLCSLPDGNVEILTIWRVLRIIRNHSSALKDVAAVQLKLHSYTLRWNWSFVSRSGWSCLYHIIHLLCPVEYFVRVSKFNWFSLCNV